MEAATMKEKDLKNITDSEFKCLILYLWALFGLATPSVCLMLQLPECWEQLICQKYNRGAAVVSAYSAAK